MHQLMLYSPAVQLPAAAAAGMQSAGLPVAIDSNNILTGMAKYGACTAWGPGVSGTAGYFTSITLTGCSVPNGQGSLVGSDADVAAIANNLKTSTDESAKIYLLTSDFLGGISTKLSASKMRSFTGIPYNRQTLDRPGQASDAGLTAKTFAECESYLDNDDRGDGTSGEKIQYKNCEGVSTWLEQKGAPNSEC